MKRFVAAAIMLVVGTISASADDVGGNYTVYGTNFDGSHYKGTATISVQTSTTCTIEWTTGTTSSTGICMRNDDSFAAAYQLGKDVGLAVYKMRSDGTLDGLWTLAGQDGSGTEILTPAD